MCRDVKKLKESGVRKLVQTRIKEFRNKRSEKEIFSELCFCILTANFNAERAILIQEKIGNGFIDLTESELAGRLRKFGHRFPTSRAKYIVQARKHLHELKKVIRGKNPREWLVKNVKGIGYKEASHFLRNIGFFDYAIIDFHILELLSRYGIVQKPKSLTRKKYLEIESILRGLAESVGISPGELDLYLWYLETGKVLK
ncbi:MAG: N-glycosylase/DNA lyase [Candidatus Micrarchaeota archaeon]|nr:N-glycosylase/DNA lyase [Candidatus Micrarchaeota archaeon]